MLTINNTSKLLRSNNKSTVAFKRQLTKKLGAALLLLGAQLLVIPANAMLPTPAAAQDGGVNSVATAPVNTSGITSQVTAYLITQNAQGGEQLTPISTNAQIARGQVIEYRTQITNNNKDRVRDMKVNISVPPQVEVIGTITPMLDAASVDGASFHRTPIRGNIGGQIQEIPVSYYKALRWNVTGLGINETKNLVYRARVR